MKTKLEMAHEYAMKHIQEGWDINYDVLVVDAWQYADAMQAEAVKREKEEAAQRRKEIREMLNTPNTFVEREGQHFDDVEVVFTTQWGYVTPLAIPHHSATLATGATLYENALNDLY